MDKETAVSARATSVDFGRGGESSSKSQSPTHAFEHASPEVVDNGDRAAHQDSDHDKKKLTWAEKLRFFKTKEFWIILGLGQFLALCVTGTNTLTTFLFMEGTSIPAFQSFFTYILLNIIYTGYTIYKYGFKGWSNMLLKDGWKCMLQTCLLKAEDCADFVTQISFFLSAMFKAITSLCLLTGTRRSFQHS